MSNAPSKNHVPDISTLRIDEHDTPVIKLIPGFGQTPPVELLQATLEYATSPRNYLTRKLGAEVVKARSHLLSLPEEPVDMPLDRDMYGTGKHKQRFEQHIAKLLGKEHGLFFITGVQAQLTALKIHCDVAGNDRVAWHYRSHLEIAEQRGFEEVFHLKRTFVGKSQLEVPTVADVEAITSLPPEERPAVMLLELPNRELGCKTYSWNDLVQISELCKAANVKLHMDGARIWEVVPYYQHEHNKSFADLAALFDSVYVSFYKGLGGVCGAMLLSSDEPFIGAAKTWQRRLGGNTVTAFQEIIDCERGFNSNIGTFHVKWLKMCSVVAAITEATAEYRTKDGQPIVSFSPSAPTCCQIHTHIQGGTEEQVDAARDSVVKQHRISVFSRRRPWKNLDEIQKAELVQRGDDPPDEGAVPEKENPKEGPEDEHHYCEWYVNDDNLGIGDDVFARGWKAFCQELANR